MAETTADVRRDIEMTRERMSDTIAQLERKLNLLEVVREHPWPSVALAASAITLLAGALEERIDAFVSDLKGAIGAPAERRPAPASTSMRDGALSGNGPAVARTGENTQAAVTNTQFVGAREPGRATELEQPM